jgi:hypothetical protein
MDMNGLREEIVKALESDKWMARHLGIVAHAGDVADTVMRVLAEHGDTEQVREQIAEILQYEMSHEQVTDILLRAVVAPIVAARDAAVEEADWFNLGCEHHRRAEADLAAARQHTALWESSVYAEIRAKREAHAAKGWTADHDREHGIGHLTALSSYYAERRHPITRENLLEAASVLIAGIDLLDAPARPAGHDETGQ